MKVKQDYIIGEDWMIMILLISLFIMAFLRFRHAKKFEILTESILHARIARQQMRDDQLFGSNFSILVALNYVLMLSYLVFVLLKFFKTELLEIYGNHLLWIIGAGILLIYTIKVISIKITEWLFDKNYGSGEYLYNVFLFNKGLGILLIPLNICLTLVSKEIALVFIWMGIALMGIILTLRILRGLQIGLENNARVLYLILYLCALEVLPTTLIVKELAGNVN